MDDQLRERIAATVTENAVVLFMKGTRGAPQCGFSARVVQMLDTLIDDYATVNVLADGALREGIKEYSSWPTIPQLYVAGKFVGGCDIVSDLYAQGALAETLGIDAVQVEPPVIHVSERARGALAAAAGGEEVIRLSISASFEHDLMVSPRQPGDVEASTEGVTIVLDPMSARRASGLSIDFVDTGNGKAFKLDNPNAPPAVKELAARDLKAWLDAGESLTLIDVRTPQERAIVRLEDSQLLDEEAAQALEELPRDTALVFYCHHGIRSRSAAEHFLRRGFSKVYNLSGGIEAWSQQVDPTLPRY